MESNVDVLNAFMIYTINMSFRHLNLIDNFIDVEFTCKSNVG